MRTVFVLLTFTLIAASAAEEDSCAVSPEGCANSEAEASTVSLMQLGMQLAEKREALEPQQLSEFAKSFFEGLRKKREFFEKLVNNSNASPAAKAAHPQFKDFLEGNDRDYHNVPNSTSHHPNGTEYLHRLDIFAKNLEEIDARNAHENVTNTHPNRAVHGITQYADWSKEEFKALLGHKGTERKEGIDNVTSLLAKSGGTAMLTAQLFPCDTKNWAWRTEVRNQGTCGSCWTFATATTLRAAYIQKYGYDPGKLSTQFLVDCMRLTTCSDGVNGCCGGDAGEAMKWIAKEGGIPTQAEYGDVFAKPAFLEEGATASRVQGGPVSHSGQGITYSGNNPTTPYPCKKNVKKAVTMTSAPETLTSEADMAKYVCDTGALAVAVDASLWQHYKSGVLQASSCGTSLDHAVTLIGINKEKNAWIIQNSWGPSYGVATDGTAPPKDAFGNCPDLVKNNGCYDTYNAWIATSCALSCGNFGPAKGGYIFLEYGANTCGVAKEAIAATSTIPASWR